eukprot:CAMPEP_0184715804 /NCGR_PEP_ID=MMETSP0314-20130426/5690_1 /TAXON_ID=38298 /ORGANISM="Rhodella maculata, Strain CCMP 736" /LENGTH=159 /DNA_ID=CAMNT_0027179071 /DNA_START=163 /DNA_END=638 /DNA_ORIENTATION=-
MNNAPFTHPPQHPPSQHPRPAGSSATRLDPANDPQSTAVVEQRMITYKLQHELDAARSEVVHLRSKLSELEAALQVRGAATAAAPSDPVPDNSHPVNNNNNNNNNHNSTLAPVVPDVAHVLPSLPAAPPPSAAEPAAPPFQHQQQQHAQQNRQAQAQLL